MSRVDVEPEYSMRTLLETINTRRVIFKPLAFDLATKVCFETSKFPASDHPDIVPSGARGQPGHAPSGQCRAKGKNVTKIMMAKAMIMRETQNQVSMSCRRARALLAAKRASLNNRFIV